MLTLAEWIIRLTKGYIRFTGKKPDGLAHLKIKLEAAQKVKDQSKVVKGNFNPKEEWWKPRPEKGGIDKVPVNKQFTRSTAKDRINQIDKELENLSTGEGKYSKMNRNEREDLMIKLQDESSTLQKEFPEDMASGGLARVGYLKGKIVKGIKSLLKPKKTKLSEADFDVAKGLDDLENIRGTKASEIMTIKLKYPGISDDLVRKIMADDNPQRKAEVFATLDEAFKMMEKGKGEDEIIKIFKDTSRTKNASGGIAGQLHMNRPGYQQGNEVLPPSLRGTRTEDKKIPYWAEKIMSYDKDVMPEEYKIPGSGGYGSVFRHAGNTALLKKQLSEKMEPYTGKGIADLAGGITAFGGGTLHELTAESPIFTDEERMVDEALPFDVGPSKKLSSEFKEDMLANLYGALYGKTGIKDKEVLDQLIKKLSKKDNWSEIFQKLIDEQKEESFLRDDDRTFRNMPQLIRVPTRNRRPWEPEFTTKMVGSRFSNKKLEQKEFIEKMEDKGKLATSATEGSFAKGGRIGFHRGSLRHQKEHDYQAYEKEGNLMKYLKLSGDRAKMSSPEHWINRLLNNPTESPARDDFETMMKERFMYGEHKPSSNFEQIWSDIKGLLKKKDEKKASGGIAGQLHLNEGGRARFQDGALAAYQSGQDIIGAPVETQTAQEEISWEPGQAAPEGYEVKRALGDEWIQRTMPPVGPAGMMPPVGPVPSEQEAREQFEAWDKAYRNATPQEHLSMGLHAGPSMVPPVPPAGTSIDGRVITQEDIDTYNFTKNRREAERLTEMQTRGIDPRMARSYQENIQLMGDPRMRGAKGGLAKILGV